jgi:hypothetical protein
MLSVLVLAFSLVFAWVANERHWIVNRRIALAAMGVSYGETHQPGWRMWLFGNDVPGCAKRISLHGPRINDRDLIHFQGLQGLESLDLSTTQITDSGLVHLEGLQKLDELNVVNTQVTDVGVEQLRKSLPHCSVWHGHRLDPPEVRIASMRDPVGCEIRGEPTCEIGKSPKITVTLTNQTDIDFFLVGSLDASDCKWRYPHCYFEVTRSGIPAGHGIGRSTPPRTTTFTHGAATVPGGWPPTKRS